jgi:hypothetical protein
MIIVLSLVYTFDIAYLDRFQKTKILQIQTGGDEFFLPDNEVK